MLVNLRLDTEETRRRGVEAHVCELQLLMREGSIARGLRIPAVAGRHLLVALHPGPGSPSVPGGIVKLLLDSGAMIEIADEVA